MEINLKVINETWKIFNSINDKLIKHGIFVNKLLENTLYFTVTFSIVKNDIFGFKFEILKNDIIISKLIDNETSISIEINPCFPAVSFLKNIFKHLEIDVYDRFENEYSQDNFDILLNNLTEEYYQSLNELSSYIEKIKKDILIIKNIKIELKTIKNDFDSSNEIEKKKIIQNNIFKNYECFKKIYKSNEKLYKDFVLITTNFIKIIFPEIFELEITRQNLPENIKMYNKKYIELSKELKYKFDNFDLKVYKQIINLLKYINDNMH